MSHTPGAFKWISMSLRLPENITVDKVIVCYQVSNARSFISQIRLSEMATPDHALVLYDDPTRLQSTTPVCYSSVTGGIAPASGAAVALELRLNFQNTADKIFLGAVGVAVREPGAPELPLRSAASLGFSPSNSGDQNSDAWDAARELASSTRGLHIIFPPGTYQFSRTLIVASQMIVEGAYGLDAASGIVFQFNSDVTGWYCNRDRAVYSEGLTCDSTGSPIVTLSGPTSVLHKNKDIDSWIQINNGLPNRIVSISGTTMVMRDSVPAGTNLAIKFAALGTAEHYVIRHIRSTGQIGTNHKAHGIDIRSAGIVENCFVEKFTGNGVSVTGRTIGDQVADEGVLRHVFCSNNMGNGFYFEGDNANVWTVEACSASDNGGWGIADGSTVGNFFAGNHCEHNWGGLLFLKSIVGTFIQGEKFTSSVGSKTGVNSSCMAVPPTNGKMNMMVSGLVSGTDFNAGEIITGLESGATAEVDSWRKYGAYGNSYVAAHHLFSGNYAESENTIYVIGASMSIGELGNNSDSAYLGEGFAQKGRTVYSFVEHLTNGGRYDIGGKNEASYVSVHRDLGNNTSLSFFDSFHSRDWGQWPANYTISFARELSAYATPSDGPAFSIGTDRSIMRFFPKQLGPGSVVFHNGIHLRYNRFDCLNEGSGATFDSRLLYRMGHGTTFAPGDIIMDVGGQSPGGYAGKICVAGGTIGTYSEGLTVIAASGTQRVQLSDFPSYLKVGYLRVGQRISIKGGASNYIHGVHVKLGYTVKTGSFSHMDVVRGNSSTALGYLDEDESGAFYFVFVVGPAFQNGETLTNLSRTGSAIAFGSPSYWLKLDSNESQTGAIAFVGASWKGVMPIEP
jgi:hypothetical protein